MEARHISVLVNKEIAPEEFAALMAAVGWGDESAYAAELVQRSLSSYPFIAHARDPGGKLVGYVSAFSDGAFSTSIGELVVHPSIQGQGVGKRLLETVEVYARGVPIYVKTFTENEGFFRKQGYSVAKRAMSVMFKMNRAVAD